MAVRALTALFLVLLPALAASCSSGDEGGSSATGAGSTLDASVPPDGGIVRSPDGSSADAPACAGKTGVSGARTLTLTSGGQARTFDLHVPPTYDATKPTPLVFLFHGYTMSAASIATATHFATTADAHGMIVAFPSGIAASFNAGSCCGTAATSNVDDVGFTRDMIASIGSAYCVDPKRVFSTGFSNGGYLSYRLACELSDQIASIASVSGLLGVNPCTPKRSVPVLHIHGTADVFAPFYGGGVTNSRPVSDSIDAFKTNNECAAGPGAVVYQQGDVSCTRWGPCAANADVELCTVIGGGHQWPGGDLLPFGLDLTSNLNASEAIARFFEAHPMP